MDIKQLTDAFLKAADREKAEKMAAYMKNQFSFHGIQSPERRKITTQLFKDWQIKTMPVDWGFVTALWEMPEREYQYVALDYLKRMQKCLDAGDLPKIKKLITTKSWWDTVDILASNVTGQIVRAHPDQAELMDEWIEDDNLWVRRTAILHQLSYKNETDQDRLFSYCRIHGSDPEFFIAKAIGWALREYGKTSPQAVTAFVERTALQKLSKREALKYLK